MGGRGPAPDVAGGLSTAALVVAHPGHELRVHGWLERHRPHVFVLTDGSGSGAASRLPSTRRVLGRASARPGGVFGRFTDRELYNVLLRRQYVPLLRVIDELTAAFRTLGVTVVAGDAAEFYNPAHDVCRLLVGCAAARTRGYGRPIDELSFPLVAIPEAGDAEPLDDSALRRKRGAALDYPELAAEVADAVRWDDAHWRFEGLRPAAPWDGRGPVPIDQPFYERYGEGKVAAGVYAHVLRYRDHLAPLAEALARHVEKGAA